MRRLRLAGRSLQVFIVYRPLGSCPINSVGVRHVFVCYSLPQTERPSPSFRDWVSCCAELNKFTSPSSRSDLELLPAIASAKICNHPSNYTTDRQAMPVLLTNYCSSSVIKLTVRTSSLFGYWLVSLDNPLPNTCLCVECDKVYVVVWLEFNRRSAVSVYIVDSYLRCVRTENYRSTWCV